MVECGHGRFLPSVLTICGPSFASDGLALLEQSSLSAAVTLCRRQFSPKECSMTGSLNHDPGEPANLEFPDRRLYRPSAMWGRFSSQQAWRQISRLRRRRAVAIYDATKRAPASRRLRPRADALPKRFNPGGWRGKRSTFSMLLRAILESIWPTIAITSYSHLTAELYWPVSTASSRFGNPGGSR